MSNNKIKTRKQLRIKEYDYSNEGYYYITICTKNKIKILSKINVGVVAHGDPQIELTQIGKIVKKYLENYNIKTTNIYIDEYIIMPNHVHLIIKLTNGSPRGATPTIPQIINSYKSMVSKKFGNTIWQRNYYEHIIRNEKEYIEIKEYIKNNPLKWENDKYYL